MTADDRPDDVELVSHGREPRRRRPSRVPAELTPAARAAVAVTLCLLLVAAASLGWRQILRQRAVEAALTPAARTFTPAPPARLLVPRFQEVRISTTDQRAYVVARGRVDLDLQLVNDGDRPVSLVGAQLPQPGVRTDSGPVQASGPTVLHPGAATAVTLHLLVDCRRALAGPAADHVELALQDASGAPRSVALDLRPLPGFWDHVRHSACAARPLVVTAEPTSVRWQGGTTNG